MGIFKAELHHQNSNKVLFDNRHSPVKWRLRMNGDTLNQLRQKDNPSSGFESAEQSKNSSSTKMEEGKPISSEGK